jgi:hypothetical protein
MPKSEPAPPKPFNDIPKIDSAPPKFDSPYSASPFSNDAGKSDSPFDKPPTSGSSPFDKPSSAPSSSPFEKTPPPPYKEPEPMFGGQQPPAFNQSPFGQPSSPFGQSNEPLNQSLQQDEWAPPAPPVAGWQDQGLGANTPFQPPAAGGQNQTLAIVSLVAGIIGILFCQLTAPVALVTGFMARKKATENPAEYGGSGLALAGMITGGIGTLLLVLVVVYFIVVFGFLASQNF